jgi:hypothetical protein
LGGEDEEIPVVNPHLDSAGTRSEKIPRAAAVGTHFHDCAERNCIAWAEGGQGQAGIKGEAGLDFARELGLTLREVGGLLAVSVVFVLCATFLADRLVAGELGGADLQGEVGAELAEDGFAEGGFVHSA